MRACRKMEAHLTVGQEDQRAWRVRVHFGASSWLEPDAQHTHLLVLELDLIVLVIRLHDVHAFAQDGLRSRGPLEAVPISRVSPSLPAFIRSDPIGVLGYNRKENHERKCRFFSGGTSWMRLGGSPSCSWEAP